MVLPLLCSQPRVWQQKQPVVRETKPFNQTFVLLLYLRWEHDCKVHSLDLNPAPPSFATPRRQVRSGRLASAPTPCSLDRMKIKGKDQGQRREHTKQSTLKVDRRGRACLHRIMGTGACKGRHHRFQILLLAVPVRAQSALHPLVAGKLEPSVGRLSKHCRRDPSIQRPKLQTICAAPSRGWG